jgi:hypothetical protein
MSRLMFIFFQLSLFYVFIHVCTLCFSLRRNSKKFQELFINDTATLRSSNYVRKNPTRIYAHGFTENGQNRLSLRLRDRKLIF